ncbi:MAG: hypothetical protein Q4C61_16745 [Lachnospiraceae bacterium]|nr:hypothetical protein [Lachnospiraceae bacterium]
MEENEKILQTIAAAKKAFYEGEQERLLSWPEFLFEQAGYIRKRWWLGQALVLLLLWWLLQASGSGHYVQRSMGVLASAFAILLIPELWKNRSSESMEIEGASYFSLRQIYAARMVLFAVVDVLLLGIFFGAATTSARMTIWEAVIQFFLPFNVTCCICFQVLCSRRFGSEYLAVVLCMLWVSVWEFVILREEVYAAVQVPIWAAAVLFSVGYLIFGIWRTLKSCERGTEVFCRWE